MTFVDILKKLSEFFNVFGEWCEKLGAIGSVCTFFSMGLLGVFLAKLSEARSQKRLLSMRKNEEYHIVFPARYGILDIVPDGGITPKSIILACSKKPESFVNANDMQAIVEAYKMLSEIEKKAIQKKDVSKIFVFRDDQKYPAEHTKFYIGGPRANRFVNQLFETREISDGFEKFKGKLKFPQLHYIMNDYVTDVVYSIESAPDGNNKRKLLIGCDLPSIIDNKNIDDLPGVDFLYDSSNPDIGGVIVLAKIPGNEFCLGHGDVILCFGYTSANTSTAIKCYCEHSKALYKVLKKNKHVKTILCCNGRTSRYTF